MLYVSALQVLSPSGECTPPDFESLIRAVLNSALDWNRTTKTEIIKYDLEPFICKPRVLWDPNRMESFERLKRAVGPRRLITSPVSFGLLGSVALVGSRVSHVQRKAQVLVEEWFGDPRQRAFSENIRAKRPNFELAPPIPKPRQRASSLRPPAPSANISPSHTSQQMKRTAPMSLTPPGGNGSPAQQPPPPSKKFLCC